MTMAEAKYDLQLVPTATGKKIYNQPWYKERLHTRYTKALGTNERSPFLHGRNWTFIKDGLDDFRDGLPPAVEKDIFLKGPGSLTPNIHGSEDKLSSVKQPAARRRFNKEEICYARVPPLQQQRRDHIEEIEYGLTQHPLALYPHLEESMPADVFEDVVDILDPEMNFLTDDDEEFVVEDVATESVATSVQTQRVVVPEQEKDSSNEEAKSRNPYRWLPKKEEKDRKDKRRANERRESSPSQDEHIKDVTKEFCDWVSSLGGESNNIEESTITSLFASGYETKPALSVPIHVVELTNVPPELHNVASNLPLPPQVKAQPLEEDEATKKDWTYSGTYQPSWVKFEYGAWYLNPQTWKVRSAGDPLIDPQEIKDQEDSEAKVKSKELDKELAPMHGAKAFMDFIDNKKNSRRPEFLNSVADIQRTTAMEEQAKLEAELAKQKHSSRRNKSDLTKSPTGYK